MPEAQLGCQVVRECARRAAEKIGVSSEGKPVLIFLHHKLPEEIYSTLSGIEEPFAIFPNVVHEMSCMETTKVWSFILMLLFYHTFLFL